MTYKIVIIVSTSLLILFSLIVAITFYDFRTDSRKKYVETRNSSAQVSENDEGQYIFEKNLTRQNEEKKNNSSKFVTRNYTNFTKRYRLFTILLLNNEKEKRNNKRYIGKSLNEKKYAFEKNISQHDWEPPSYDIENSTPSINKIFSKFARFRMEENELKVDEIKAFNRRFIPRHITEKIEDADINKDSISGFKKIGKYKNSAGEVYKTCDSCENADESRRKRSTEQSSNIEDKSKQQLKKLLHNIKSEEDISSVNLETTSQLYEKTSQTETEKSEYIIEDMPRQTKSDQGLKMENNNQRKITENLKNEIQRIILEGVVRNLPFAQVVDKLNKLENKVETIFQDMHVVLRKFDIFFNKMLSHLHGRKGENLSDQLKVHEKKNKFTNEKNTLSNSRRSGDNLDVYNQNGQDYLEKVNLFQSLINKLDDIKGGKDTESVSKPAMSPDLLPDLTSPVEEKKQFDKSVPNYTNQKFINRKSEVNEKIKMAVEGKNEVYQEIVLPQRRYSIPLLEEMYDKKKIISEAGVQVKKPNKIIDYENQRNKFNINNVLHTLLENLETKHASKETIDYFDDEYRVGGRKSAPNIKIKGEIIYSSPNGMSKESHDRNSHKNNKNIERLVTTLYKDISTKYKDSDISKSVFNQLYHDNNKNDIEKFITYLIESLGETFVKNKPEKAHMPKKKYVLELSGNFRETKDTGPYLEQTVKKTIHEHDKPYSNDVLLKLLKTYLEKNVDWKNTEEHLPLKRTRFRRSSDIENLLETDEGLNYKNPDQSKLRKKSVIDKIFEYIIHFLGVDCNKRKKDKYVLNSNLNKHKLQSNVRIEKLTNANRNESIFRIGDFIHDMRERIVKEMGKVNPSKKIEILQHENNKKNMENSEEYSKDKSVFIINDKSIENNFIEIGRRLSKTANEKTKMYRNKETKSFDELENDLGYSKEVEFASLNKDEVRKHRKHKSQRPVPHKRTRRDVAMNMQRVINDDIKMKTNDYSNVAKYNPNRAIDSKLEPDIASFLDFLSDQDSSTSTNISTNYEEKNIKEENRNRTRNIKIENTLEQPAAKLLDYNGRKRLRNKHMDDYERIRDGIFAEISDSQENSNNNDQKLDTQKKNDSNERFLEMKSSENKGLELNGRLIDEESVDNDYKMFLKKNMKPIDIFSVNDNFDNTKRYIRSTTNIEINSSEGLRVTGSTIPSQRYYKDSQISEKDRLHNLFKLLVSKNIGNSINNSSFEYTHNKEKTKNNHPHNFDKKKNMFKGIFDITQMLEAQRHKKYDYDTEVDNSKPIFDETPKRNIFKHNKKRKIIKLTRKQLNDLIINAHLNLKSIENEGKTTKSSLYTEYHPIGNEMITQKNIALEDSHTQINSTNLINKIDNLTQIMKTLEKFTIEFKTEIPTTTEESILMDEILMCGKIANSTDGNTSKGLFKILKSIAEKNKITHNLASFKDQIIHICNDILNTAIKGPIESPSDMNKTENIINEPVVFFQINENQSNTSIVEKEIDKNIYENNKLKNKQKANKNNEQNSKNLQTKKSGNDLQTISDVKKNTVLEPMMLYKVDSYDGNYDKQKVSKDQDENKLGSLSLDDLIASPVVLHPLGMAVVYSDSVELVTNDTVKLK